jgi:phosphatidylinositol-3-phosphatase
VAVRHVWVIELENQGYAQSFGTPSADPYLATTLPRMGALLENYYASCVYPAVVPTLGNQLSAAGRSWAAYLQDMGNDPARDHTVATARGPACGHPATWPSITPRKPQTARSCCPP